MRSYIHNRELKQHGAVMRGRLSLAKCLFISNHASLIPDPVLIVIIHIPRTFTGTGYAHCECILSTECIRGPRLLSGAHVRNSSGLYQCHDICLLCHPSGVTSGLLCLTFYH